MSFPDLNIAMHSGDKTGETVIGQIGSTAGTTTTKRLIRDRLTCNREYVKTNAGVGVAPRQANIPYDKVRLRYTWIGHIDVSIESVAGSGSGDTLRKLMRATLIDDNFEHEIPNYSNTTPGDPAPIGVISHDSDEFSRKFIYAYEEKSPATDPPTYTALKSKAWFIKSTDVQYIAPNLARVTFVFEKFTAWRDVSYEIEQGGQKDTTDGTTE